MPAIEVPLGGLNGEVLAHAILDYDRNTTSIREAARLMRCGEWAMRKRCQRGDYASVRVGHHRRVCDPEVLRARDREREALDRKLARAERGGGHA